MSQGKRLRLLKVIVQPVFVIDDGETLIEDPAQPVTVPASAWPGYATGPFLQAQEELRKRVESDD